jgi:hypothetical protein
VTVAIDGEQADPRVPAPAELRPVLGFSRLSAAAYGTIARVVDEDGIFRARVAEAADEEAIGRAGWLWLHRPAGWLDDPAVTGAGSPDRGDDTGDKRDQRAARLRKAAAEAEAARRRTAEQLAELRRSEAELRSERDRLAAEVAALHEERNAAMRRSKEIEAHLATARRDLKVARQATRDAEIELATLRAAPVAPSRPAAPTEPTRPTEPPFDRAGVASSVHAAASAAAELAAALADAASALDAPEGPGRASVAPPPAPAPLTGPSTGRKPRATGAARRRAERAHPALPPGVFDGTPEAHRHLLADRANLLVVDGYNLARAAWSGLNPEEERRRTVSLLEEVQARSGGAVMVVFDGDDAVTAPKASKNVRVRFSATGQTADDAIVHLLAGTPTPTPVVVVSSDREVAADARRQGAVALGARDFLAAAGR